MAPKRTTVAAPRDKSCRGRPRREKAQQGGNEQRQDEATCHVGELAGDESREPRLQDVIVHDEEHDRRERKRAKNSGISGNTAPDAA